MSVKLAEVLEHIRREPLPWRLMETLTECGRDTADVAAVISRAEAKAKINAQGQKRAAFSTCMTCWDTVRQHPTWLENPAAALARVLNDVRWRNDTRAELVNRELRVLAALTTAHPEEFAEMMVGLAGTTDLAARRRARRDGVKPFGGAS